MGNSEQKPAANDTRDKSDPALAPESGNPKSRDQRPDEKPTHPDPQDIPQDESGRHENAA